MKQLKKVRSYIGSLLIASFMLQVATPLIAAANEQPRPMQRQKQLRSHTRENLTVDDTLAAYITTIVQDALQADLYDQLPKSIKRCYRSMTKNNRGFSQEDILAALPSILRYAFEALNESDTAPECAASMLALLMLTEHQLATLPDSANRTAIIATLADARSECKHIPEVASKVKRMVKNETQMTKFPADECCMVLEEALAQNLDDIIDTQTTLAQSLSTIEESLSECCETLHNSITNAQNTILEAIDNFCAPFPLMQSTVVSGSLVLSQAGNYRFCEDITANLVISGSGIAVEMNNRCLFGLVSILANDIVLENGFIQAPAPIVDAPAAIVILNEAVNTRLLKLVITCVDSTVFDSNNNGLDGRNGIFNTGIQTFIADSSVQSGAGAPGGNAQGNPNPLAAGRGGDGGKGIISLNDKLTIARTRIITGNGGNGGKTDFGGALKVAGNGGSSQTGIVILGDFSSVFESEILTGNGGMGGHSCCDDGGNGGNSGNGIFNKSSYSEIRNSTIRTGHGGTGGKGNRDIGGDGGNSGNAITTHGTQIVSVIVSTGNGGNGANGTIGGGDGGNAGYGIFVNNACECQMRDIIVDRTGNGGDGGNATQNLMPGNGGNGGNGGDAVYITAGSKHTELRLSTLTRTGRGGIGGSHTATGGITGSNGIPGRAVTDLNTDDCSVDPACTTTYQGPSIIFENFAFAISDTAIRYLINGKYEESGTASDRSCNTLDNVFVDCTVNVVENACQGFDLINSLSTTFAAFAECCENLHADIFDTQTILLALGIEVHNNTSTILENIEACCEELSGAVENCCTTVREDIVTTQTMLSTQLEKLTDIVEICCETLQDELYATNTLISTSITALALQVDADVVELGKTFTTCCSTLTSTFEACCSELQEAIATATTVIPTELEYSKQTFNECCETISQDIFNTQTTLSNEIELIEKCDFIILNSNPNADPNVHVVNDPITIPGVYCVGENLIGTLTINTSAVSILFYGFTLTAPAGNVGIISNGNNTIKVQDGIITNATTAIDIESGTSIEIRNMSFAGNAVGITLNNIQNFNLQTCLFTDYIDTSINLENSTNGAITACTIHNNNTTNPMDSLNLINIATCNQLTFDTIIMTENSMTATLFGINAIAINNTTFNNVHITNNQVSAALQGIYLENSDNNIFTNCSISGNSITSSTNAVFIGIEITASIDSGSQNNSISCCTVNENTSSLSAYNSSTFVGINIAGALLGNSIPDNACANCSVDACSIQSNGVSGNGYSSFIGTNLAGSVYGTVGTGVCSDCSVTNCTINNNNNISSSYNTYFVGVNLAGSIDGDGIGQSCTSCLVANCTINNNNNTTSANNTSYFAGINLAGSIAGENIGQSCINCSVTTCSINNNTNSSSNDSYCVGINLASSIDGGSIGSGDYCSITNCSINDNAVNSGGAFTALLIGINLASSFIGGTVALNACSSCSVTNCSINNNSITNSNTLFLIGINLASAITGGTVESNACSSCSVTNCSINSNSSGVSNSTYFIGINFANAIAEGTVEYNTCSSCSVTSCSINKNNIGTSIIPLFIGINLASSTNSGTIVGASCNGCLIERTKIYQNTVTSTTSSGQLLGINLNGNPGSSNGGCNSINIGTCFIENNTISNAGSFIGFLINGTGATNLNGGCNNLIVTSCNVSSNKGIQSSDAYQVIGAPNGGIGGGCNIEFTECSAKQNTAFNGTLNGFDISNAANNSLLECVSFANTSTGFLLTDITYSLLRACKALGNGADGFSCTQGTTNVAITNSIALGNDVNGFDFTDTTSLCYCAHNFAQDNGDTGFYDNTNNVFVHNFAQNNGVANYNGVVSASIQSLTTPPTNPFANTTP